MFSIFALLVLYYLKMPKRAQMEIKKPHRLTGLACGLFYRHGLIKTPAQSHRSGFSTLPSGRLLRGRRACPSHALHG